MTTPDFSALTFTPKRGGFGSQAKITFANGYSASVITGAGAYGGDDGLYELAVIRDGRICYDTPVTDDVIGHLSPDDVTAARIAVAALPAPVSA